MKPRNERAERPAYAASWPGPPQGAALRVIPPAPYEPPPVQEPPAPRGKVSKLTYTVTEAAEAIGVSRATMYALIHREGFPSLKVGGRRLISRELLAEWVRRQAGGQGVSG